MPTFFDPKQDVIDIELTKYGEYLLSLGKFNPVYYSFFDNNVLYDPRYAGFSGSQNNFEGRIQNDTPSMRTQHSFEGRGEQVMNYVANISENYTYHNFNSLREDEKIRFPSTVDKNFTSLYQPLGHSDLSATKAPAWKMRFYNNEMLNWEINYTGSRFVQDIPQIDATITYKTRIGAEETPHLPEGSMPGGKYPQTGEDGSLMTAPFPDGTYVTVEPDPILIDLQELNSLYERENFEIEVYEIQSETLIKGDIRDILIPLKFRPTSRKIVDNILVDVTEEPEVSDPAFVDYFFDVLTDEEIDDVIICKSLSKLKTKGFYIDTEFDCPDVSIVTQEGDVYPTENIESENCSPEDGS